MIDSSFSRKIILDSTRVRDVDGFIGTIRYVGPVASAKDPSEIYIGIEWDDSSRGKHDGSVICRTTNHIVRHFSCKKKHLTSPSSSMNNAGSFVRPKMVDYGVPLTVSLIHTRYVTLDSPLVAPNGIIDVAKTSRGKDKNIEFIGELQVRKRQQLPLLKVLSLRNMGIAYVPTTTTTCPQNHKNTNSIIMTMDNQEEDQDLQQQQQHQYQQLKQSDFAQLVQELDLAGNLISSWNTVWDIVDIFPQLKHISFAYNQIMDNEDNKYYEDNISTCASTTVTTSSTEDDDDHYIQKRNKTFPILTRWNLNECNIGSFHTILSVEKACPNLQELYVAQNDFVDITSCSDDDNGCCCRNHKTDDTPHINMEEITNTMKSNSILLQSLEEDEDAETHHNNKTNPRQAQLNDPILPFHVFQHLTKLDLTNCKLYSWTLQVRMLRKLPQLQVLILNDNPITEITMAAKNGKDDNNNNNDDDDDEFISLQELHLGGTQFHSWKSIHILNFFPQLTYLRLSLTPLTNALGVGESRIQIIARISNLQHVNASPVTSKERIEAERRYIRCVAHELLKLQQQKQQQYGSSTTQQEYDNEEEDKKKKHLLDQHPLFESLFIKHKDSMMISSTSSSTTWIDGGGVTGTNTSNAQSSSHYNNLQITIRSMATGSITAEPLHKKLPASFPIGRLKTLCFKSFGLDIHLQRLHVRCEGDAFPTELEDDEHTLEYYGVSDGAEILMNEIDVEAKEKELQKEKEMHEQRIEQQERSMATLQARKNKE